MSWALNNITAPDNYTTAASLTGLPVSTRVNLDVANSSIYWQLLISQNGLEGQATWTPEVFMAPGSRSLLRLGVVGVRVRAAVPLASIPATGKQAQVTVEVV